MVLEVLNKLQLVTKETIHINNCFSQLKIKNLLRTKFKFKHHYNIWLINYVSSILNITLFLIKGCLIYDLKRFTTDGHENFIIIISITYLLSHSIKCQSVYSTRNGYFYTKYILSFKHFLTNLSDYSKQ